MNPCATKVAFQKLHCSVRNNILVEENAHTQQRPVRDVIEQKILRTYGTLICMGKPVSTNIKSLTGLK